MHGAFSGNAAKRSFAAIGRDGGSCSVCICTGPSVADFDPSIGGPIGCQGRPGSGILKGNPLEHSAWHPAVATGAFGTGAKQAWGVFDSTRAANNIKEGGSICLTGLSFQ